MLTPFLFGCPPVMLITDSPLDTSYARNAREQRIASKKASTKAATKPPCNLFHASLLGLDLSDETPQEIFIDSDTDDRNSGEESDPVPSPTPDTVAAIPEQPGILAPVAIYHLVAITVHHMVRRETVTWIFHAQQTVKDVHEYCSQIWHERFLIQQNNVLAADEVTLDYLDPACQHQSALMITPIQPIRVAAPLQHVEDFPCLENEIVVRVLNVLEHKVIRLTLLRTTLTAELVSMLNEEWKSNFVLRFLDADCMIRYPVEKFNVATNYNSAVLAFDCIPPTMGRPPIVPPFDLYPVQTLLPTNRRRIQPKHAPRTPQTTQTAPPPQPPSRMSEVSAKSRSLIHARTSTTTVLGPVPPLPPKPVICAPVTTEPGHGVSSPPTRVDKALNELEEAFGEEKSLEPPSSKASAARKRRRENDESAAPSSHPLQLSGSQTHDQTLDEYDYDDSDFDDPAVSTPAFRQRQLERDLEAAHDLWHRASHPQRDNELIFLDGLSEGVLTFLRRGKKFLELVPSMGINQATKTSRNLGRKRGQGFSSHRDEFEILARQHNAAVLDLRRSRPLKKRRF